MDLSELIGPIQNDKPDPVHFRKAILWGRDDLLTQVVHSFFDSAVWEVTRVPNNGEVEELIRKTQCIHPEIVVLCQDKADEDPDLPLRLIHEQLCLKVITLGLDSNLVKVYSQQNFTLEGTSDLVSIIEAGRSRPCTLEKEVRPTKSLPE